jgi:hypothetical protein
MGNFLEEVFFRMAVVAKLCTDCPQNILVLRCMRLVAARTVPTYYRGVSEPLFMGLLGSGVATVAKRLFGIEEFVVMVRNMWIMTSCALTL